MSTLLSNNNRILDNVRPVLPSDLRALQFAGGVLTSRVDSPNNASLNLTNAATVECWFIYDSITAGVNAHVVGQGNTGTQAFHFGVGTATPRKLEGRVSNGTTILSILSTTTLVAGTLYHVVLTYDLADAGGTARLYINGIEEATGSIGTGISLPANKTFTIGSIFANSSANRNLVGRIDNVRLYSRAITAAEVTAHYGGTFSDNSNLLINWKCDTGFGTGVADISGNNFHGTFMNTTDVTWVARLVDF